MEDLKGRIVLIAHDIRSAHNVGALFRTASGAGVEKIYLSGVTQAPAPKTKMFLTKAEKELAKTALGAEGEIPYEVKEIENILETLQQEEYYIIGLEQSLDSVSYTTKPPKNKVALLIGTEVTGVPEELQKKCDALYEIPMHGRKNSLNVAVATGIALYALRSTLE